MIVLACLACTVAAVWLAIGPPPARRLSGRLAVGEPAAVMFRRAGGRRWIWPLAVMVQLLLVGLIAGLAGMSWAVAAAASAVVLGTTSRLVQLGLNRRAEDRTRADVAHACRIVAGQLRVGRVPAEALQIAAADCPVLAPAAAGLTLGADPADLWHRQSRRAGFGGLAVLARAWRLSVDSGAPLAPALEQVSGALAEDLAVQRVVSAEASAARSTGKLMAALPFFGIALGYLIGGRPLAFLLSGPLGWASLLGGVTLAAVGVTWIERLARRATEAE